MNFSPIWNPTYIFYPVVCITPISVSGDEWLKPTSPTIPQTTSHNKCAKS